MILGYSWLGQSGLLSMLAELGDFKTGEDSSKQRESTTRPVTDGDLEVPSVNGVDGDDMSAPKYERVFVNDANLASEIDSLVADFGEIFGSIPPAGAKVKPFEINLSAQCKRHASQKTQTLGQTYYFLTIFHLTTHLATHGCTGVHAGTS